MNSPVLTLDQARIRIAEAADDIRALGVVRLEEILGRRVELVTTEALSPYIGPKILAEAQDVLRAA